MSKLNEAKKLVDNRIILAMLSLVLSFIAVTTCYLVISHISVYLQAGVSKLNEAKELVDNLKRKAAEQSLVLAEKQTEADNSLKEITTTMQAS